MSCTLVQHLFPPYLGMWHFMFVYIWKAFEKETYSQCPSAWKWYECRCWVRVFGELQTVTIKRQRSKKTTGNAVEPEAYRSCNGPGHYKARDSPTRCLFVCSGHLGLLPAGPVQLGIKIFDPRSSCYGPNCRFKCLPSKDYRSPQKLTVLIWLLAIKRKRALNLSLKSKTNESRSQGVEGMYN